MAWNSFEPTKGQHVLWQSTGRVGQIVDTTTKDDKGIVVVKVKFNDLGYTMDFLISQFKAQFRELPFN
ncbi:hypothetical protein KJ785_01225 [Patescibacteria group bacterium]|nr:hypothetical protein [Patescibacteria group bacterium]